ncbi:MAG: ParB/RepB/Spo0J family partition protein [Lachnospiraceae bacterium]|nr:ParB/RepB/Spo0J family partition protein [Lachnospiraceae bacterium]
MTDEKTSMMIEEKEKVIELDIERLRTFKDHPFRVEADGKMAELKESIEKFGIINPLIVRPMKDGSYEIISGHRRKYAAEQLGYKKVPVIVRVMEDGDAIIAMVESNQQREFIYPSEKAYAYRMKYDVMKRRQGRKKRGQVISNYTGKRTVQILAEEFGDSPKQVQRYLKISQLIPGLIKKLDEGMLSVNPAVELAFMKEADQRIMLAVLDETELVPSLSQAQRLKQMSYDNCLSKETAVQVLGEIKRGAISRVEFKNEQLYRFFPRWYSAAEMKREIIEILKIWTDKKMNS